MLMLSVELANENSQMHIRNAAGLALKNALSARVRKKSRFLKLMSSCRHLGGCKAKRVR